MNTRSDRMGAILRALCISCFVLFVTMAPALARASGGNLDQGANGELTTDLSQIQNPVDWVNGDLNAGNSHYIEGHSVPYRLILTGLSLGPHIVHIEWDIRDQGKAALDYITQFERLEPHTQFIPSHPAETVDPTVGLTGIGPPSTRDIDAPDSTGTTVDTQPTASFNLLPANKRVMTIYNGNITDMHYVTQGSLTALHSSTSLEIKFDAVDDTVVLAWGGHIANNADWDGGAHPGGSPYHTRFLDLVGARGNQDR